MASNLDTSAPPATSPPLTPANDSPVATLAATSRNNSSTSPGSGDSFWWNHVQVLGDYGTLRGRSRQFKCNYCLSEKTGGGDRVRAHLCGEKGRGIAICQMVPSAMKQLLLARRDGEKKIRNQSSATAFSGGSFSGTSQPPSGSQFRQLDDVNIEPVQVTPTATTYRRHQPTLEATWQPGKKAMVDASIARYFYECGVSFNTVRSPFFLNMVKELVEYTGPYQVPSYEAFRTRLLLESKNQIEEALVPI